MDLRGGISTLVWGGRASAWAAVALTAVALAAVGLWVDLAPRVEGSFFFAPDDPQFRESLLIQERYPARERVIVRVGGDPASEEYVAGVRALGDSLSGVPGIASVSSVATEDAVRSPLWARLLTVPDSTATNLIVEVEEGAEIGPLVREMDRVLSRNEFEIGSPVASGAPVIVERIRRSLFRDLLVFSTASLAVFGLLLAVFYRSASTVVGALSTCLTACAATLLLTQATGIGIGLLTANIVTIVFVLTLSHVVFLTANWQSERGGDLRGGDLRGGHPRGSDRATRRAVRAVLRTIEPSVWAMLTTLLGFLSLLAASAKPLRDLGLAGAVGTATAIGVAYLIYPIFLVRRGRVEPGGDLAPEGGPVPHEIAGAARPTIGIASEHEPGFGKGSAGPIAAWLRRRRGLVLGATALVVILLGAGTARLDTDPGLLTYFAPDGDIREGLEQIDREGGSSSLEITVRDPEGTIDTGPAYDRMWAFHDSIEQDPAVGVVLSPAVVIAEAKRQPLAGLLSVRVLLDIAALTPFQSSIRSFVFEERSEGRFSLRMRESASERSRADVIDRLSSHASAVGLEVTGVGGLYDLQRELGGLIRKSVILGLAGLLFLFLGVSLFASRNIRATGLMFASLVGIPLVVLGVFGHFGIAVDIITSPAANLALAMGVDSMIHLVVRWRRLRSQDGRTDPMGEANLWWSARNELVPPVLAVSAMTAVGFGIFTLSAFPPTQRFGLAVILGTATAAFMALVVLPLLASADR